MYSVDTGCGILTICPERIEFGGVSLQAEEIDTISIKVADTYINGAWVNGDRVVTVEGADRVVHRRITIDCSRSFPDRQKLDALYEAVYGSIWSVAGPALVGRAIAKLVQETEVELAGVRVSRNGVLLDGPWKILWLKAKPKLVPWRDLEISNTGGTLTLRSLGDLRFHTDVEVNNTENAVVLDAVVRHLLHDNNWKLIG